MFDFRWLAAKLGAVGPAVLPSDYDELVIDGEQGVLMADTLRLSGHVLARRPEQLASQLLGRLGPERGSDIARLLEDARERVEKPALLPVRPVLTPPGTELVRRLEGHEDWVYAVALTADARRVLSGGRDGTLRLWDLERGVENRA